MQTKPQPNKGHIFHPSILREYDIRGIMGETLSADDAYAIGRAFALFDPAWKNSPPIIAVGKDGRASSPEREEALVQGLCDSGATVKRIGVGPTPMLYYTVCEHQLSGGIMVTGSHNPPNHNGFKFMRGRKAFYGQDIQHLGKIAAEEQPAPASYGKAETLSVEEAYINVLLKGYAHDEPKRHLKVAWDAGNGATGRIMTALANRLPGTHIPLFAEIDGTFPNHHPDPSVAENLEDLIHTVQKQKCDIGIAFDGDGDRIGVIDETGAILWGDQLLAVFAQSLLVKHPGATIIADVKASQTLFDAVAQWGGKPLMWKTGHSLIKTKMAETGALIAGEMSGHMFIADNYYGYDDGLYAAVRILSLLSASGKKLSELRACLPTTFPTPELRLDCDEVRKFTIVAEIKAQLEKEGASVSDVDGVRVKTKQGWWLLRASNTQAAIVARAESTSEAGLAELKAELETRVKKYGMSLAAQAKH